MRKLLRLFRQCSFCGHIELFHGMKLTMKNGKLQEYWRTCSLCGDLCTQAVREWFDEREHDRHL